MTDEKLTDLIKKAIKALKEGPITYRDTHEITETGIAQEVLDAAVLRHKVICERHTAAGVVKTTYSLNK